MKKAPEKQELFLFSILALLVSLCHLSLIHSGQCILQNLRKVHMNVFSTLIFVSFTSFHPNLLCCRMDISPIPPLYTDFDGDIENIFVRLILTSSRSIHRSEKRESAIFSHSRMDFTPKR